MKRLLTSLVLGMISLVSVTAQSGPKSAGFGMSYYILTGEYQHWKNESRSSFHSIKAGIDFEDIFDKSLKLPGVYASYTYDFVFARKTANGGIISLYTGPGLAAGWVKDWDSIFGMMAGLKLDVGFEYTSPYSPLSIGAEIGPVLGLHMHRRPDESYAMDYLNGVITCLIPQVTVRYNFGRQYTPIEITPRTRFGYGAEMSYNMMFARHLKQNYIDNDGLRHNSNNTKAVLMGHFLILAHVGVNVGSRYNLSLASGYTTIGYDAASAIPLLARGRISYAGGILFNYISVGPAFSLSHSFYNVPWLYGIGAGYSTAPSKRCRLDLKAALVGSHARPLIEGDNRTIYSSKEDMFGINLGMVFGF